MYNPFHRLMKRHVGHPLECRIDPSTKVTDIQCLKCGVVLIDAEPDDQPDFNPADCHDSLLSDDLDPPTKVFLEPSDDIADEVVEEPLLDTDKVHR